MSTPRPLPPDLGPEFSARAALDAGVSRRRLRHSSLEAPFRGARMRRVACSPDAGIDPNPVAAEATRLRAEIVRRARAYAAVAPEYAFFSHTVAVVLWEQPAPLRLLRDAAAHLDVGVLAPQRAVRGAGVHAHRMAARLTSVRTRGGLRLTSPASTWASLAAELTVDELVELGDAIVRVPRVPTAGGMVRGREGSGLATIAQLTAAMNAGRRTGIAKLREALPQIRVGSASPPETRLRLACLRNGLPEPELDYDVFAADGNMIGYTEMAYVLFRILIEYEGDHHRTDRDQWHRDIEKHAACVAAGWEVLRLTSVHMRDGGMPAVTRIRDALVRAGWRP